MITNGSTVQKHTHTHKYHLRHTNQLIDVNCEFQLMKFIHTEHVLHIHYSYTTTKYNQTNTINQNSQEKLKQ